MPKENIWILELNHVNWPGDLNTWEIIIHNTVKWGDIEQQSDIEQSYPFHGNSLNSSYNIHAQDACVLDCTLNVSVPQSQNFLNVPTTFDLLFLPKQKFSNKKVWCLEIKLWLKVTFSQHVQGYAETCLICSCHRLLLFRQEKFA